MNTLSLSILNEHCCLPVSGHSNYPQFPLPTQFFTLPQMTLHVRRALYRVADELSRETSWMCVVNRYPVYCYNQ